MFFNESNNFVFLTIYTIRYVQHGFKAAAEGAAPEDDDDAPRPGVYVARGWASSDNDVRYNTVVEVVLHANGSVTGESQGFQSGCC